LFFIFAKRREAGKVVLVDRRGVRVIQLLVLLVHAAEGFYMLLSTSFFGRRWTSTQLDRH
jgi:hypothetical protein